LGDYEVTVDETSARLKDGTLAGSILRMDQAVRNLMQYSGCSLAQAVGAASINPARLIGADQKGRLQPGADADLLLMDAQGNLMVSIANGEVVFSRL
jgi:N-acetylglucosamine-6-phosphate deacetylase